jgi:hypothetical protein
MRNTWVPEGIRRIVERIREDIRAALENDPAARSAWEVVLCYPGAGLINALTNAQPGQASVWACGGCPVSIRNITEALLTNDVERHTADGMERPANLSGMIPVFLIRHV